MNTRDSCERFTLWFASACVALTRIPALSRSLWDWDEALFCFAMQDYDVPAYRPHPPGFPLFLAAARAARTLLSLSDFHALQAITFLSSCALFPLAVLLARSLRFSMRTSMLAALLFVFLPNVWFYGGTGLSDLPAIALTLAAAVLLLRGSGLAGAIVLGIAIGVRPQAALFGCAPFLVFAWNERRRWKRVAAAASIVLLISLASYLGAALASSSVGAYARSIAVHARMFREVDAFTNPSRPPVVSLLGDYLVTPMGGGRLSMFVALLALIGLLHVRGEARVAIAVAMFAPFALFALFMTDVNSVHRFSTAYVLLYALLAAHAASLLPRRLDIALIALIALRYAWWTVPALREVHGSDSPPVAARHWVETRQLRGAVDPSMTVFVTAATDPNVYVTEGVTAAASATMFARPRGRAWEIARHRHFEVSVLPLSDVWTFGDGWYWPEDDGQHAWRWMGRRSETILPPLHGRARLSLKLDSAAPFTDVEVSVDGVVIDRFRCTQTTKQWELDATGKPVHLVLESSTSTHVVRDPRELSLRLTRYEWSVPW
jgi:hypothetical protein